MYNKIGTTIKAIAIAQCLLGVIGSLIIALLFMKNDPLTGVVILIGGPIASWLSSLLSYGFGEMIEKITEIADTTRQIEEKIESSELFNEDFANNIADEEPYSYETLDL